ncbi:AsnC family transcriptional regulator [Kordiimonas sediminis]|uniref:AsnC family transcriptional regulator n=2 Tax=Kordiimonas sediminis TaxID=1735581 RepID=A0A919APT9_9PROT|nr:AsnC family transcriptional regulator [Kordiimonas sediminis]
MHIGLDETDRKLFALLREDARRSVSDLARTLKLSRSTVQDRIARLEDRGFINGYTVRVGEDYLGRTVLAHVMLKIKPKVQDDVVAFCARQKVITSLYTISGEYDLAAVLRAATTAELDETLDALGKLDGVERTQTSVVLSTKFERG